MQEVKVNVKREYKDTVFRMLFGEKGHLLELYNGLNGTDYQDESELEIYTLENAIYMGMKNDVSFLLMSELNLYEHQSSYNANMPLRDLLYIARQYERYIKGKSLYSGKAIKLPTPSFVVFYNGSDAQPEKRVLKLSDSFEKKAEDPKLELKVLQINVNDGKNRELMERCRTLREYSQYVACVRKYTKLEPIEEAVDHAVTECIREGILREFLQKQRAEVVAMSIFEYDEEEEKRMLREAYREEAMEDAREAVRAEVREEVREEIKGEVREEVKAEVKEEVKEEVEAEVREEFLRLIQKLIAQGRGDEIERIVTEKAYREAVWEELGLTEEGPKKEE